MPAEPLFWGKRRLPVPWAASWSGERVAVSGDLVARPDGTGLAYRDETADDRDRYGVLWARLAGSPGNGRPAFGTLHSGRQRHAMLRRLCQVCGGPADRTSRGWLFLLPHSGHPAGEPPGRTEGALSTKPPVCRPCADLAARHCPHLTGAIAVRCRGPRVWGVFGGLCVPAPGGRLVSPTDGYLPYGHPATPWFLASQLVIRLTRCTRTSLTAEGLGRTGDG
ncbi:hypothetical protein [Streptomyces aidingensis]|nr:hypothetical protein [Streptomyces aidingensis]